MTPGFVGGLVEAGLLVAILGGVAGIVLVIGWSIVWWVEGLRNRRDHERQRLLLARLYELEVTCGREFSMVELTVVYVRGLVLEADGAGDVVSFRAGLRARYGREEQGGGEHD